MSLYNNNMNHNNNKIYFMTKQAICKIIKINPIIILITISSLTILFKWMTSFYIYPEEQLYLKNILDLEDIIYFPYILNLIEFNFSPNYLEGLIADKTIPIPIYSLIIHSIFYFFFKSFTFLIIEFLSLSIFLIILFKIFKELNLSSSFSILLSVFIFTFIQYAPIIFSTLNISSFIHLDVFSNLYSFRVPRPIITSLYFFFSIFLLIKIFKGQGKNNLYIFLGFFLGLSLGSYFYQFMILGLATFFVLLQSFVCQKKKSFFQFIKKNLLVLIPFLITILPFLILSYYAEPDLLKRLGVVSIEWHQKKIILSYIFFKLAEFQFLIIFVLNTLLFIILIIANHHFCKKTISIFYFLFFSSIISPILFLLLSPKNLEFYNFLNWIVIIGLIVFLIFSVLLFLNFANFTKKKKYQKNYNDFFFLLITLMLIIFYNLNYLDAFKDKKDNFLREDFVQLEKYYQINRLNLNNLMSFDGRIQVWWLLHGEKKLTTINSSMNSLTNNQVESNFIKNLKYLNIKGDAFNSFLQNKKQGWRYDNKILKYFSWYTYQANSLITFNNSQNFDKIELDFIKKTPLTRSQQIALPKEERDRLIKLYENFDSSFTNEIDIIILKKNSIIESNAVIDKKRFCQLNTTKVFNIYINSKKMKCY